MYADVAGGGDLDRRLRLLLLPVLVGRLPGADASADWALVSAAFAVVARDM